MAADVIRGKASMFTPKTLVPTIVFHGGFGVLGMWMLMRAVGV